MVKDIEIIQISKITPDIVKKYSIFDVGKKMQDIVYNNLQELCQIYPNFNQWYNKTVSPEVNMGKTREILLAMLPETIVGIVILKKANEKKICTLKVHNDYTRHGIGAQLFEESFNYLEDVKPTFTVSGIQKDNFMPLIKRFDFKLVQELPDFYIKGATEFVYNHAIVPEN